ncbi:SAM-dependent methyltransferase [Cryptosporangium arvum]|uniref:Putative methyltransferase n=1 Tax=Cryptosporangium arvum DSM 44712 TaxID=927661 RepID=A0A011AG96_9ACTN|nr:SAM-dependent methyltransferase [Cryptosporangium arvum]EXG81046.1 putative methyltransferase [Cryptosporangium arvum DSM 44712]
MTSMLHAPRSRTPVEVDSFRPSAARMYDYYLGGRNHLAADREAADALLDAVPEVVTAAQQNRAFLRRVVEYAVGQGVTQFLDLGSGYASPGGVPEVACAGDATSRVVAVDIDPGVTAQVGSTARATGVSGRVGAIHADLRDAIGVLEHPVTRRLIDFDRPVAILCLAVLHFVPGELDRVLGPLRRAAPRGSLLAFSHAAASEAPTTTERITRLVYDCTLTPLVLRSEETLTAAVSGLELVDPGIVPVNRWRAPDADAPASTLLGGVARL